VGRLDRVQTPMLWAIGFIFLLHSARHRRRCWPMPASIACCRIPTTWSRHFPLLLSLGAVFAIFAGLVLLVPKMTGYMYSEAIGRRTLVHLHRRQSGVLPQHFLGLSGMPRRYVDYPTRFAGWNLVSSIGSYISGFRHADLPLRPDRRLFCAAAGGRQSVGRRRHHVEWTLPSPPRSTV